MKKNLFLLALLAFATLGFTACSGDSDTEDTSIVYDFPSFADDALKLEVLEVVELTLEEKSYELEEIELTESGNYFVRLANPKEVRAASSYRYLFGLVQKKANLIYSLVNFGKMTLAQTSATTYNVEIILLDGTILQFTARLSGSGPGYLTNISTTNVCKTWKVRSTRVQIEGDSGFYQEDGCNINSIVEYVKEHAKITDSFEANQVVTDVLFTKHSTFALCYANGHFDKGSWKWDNLSKLTITYNWDSTEMGFSFANGKGQFKFQKDYCQLQLFGTVKNDANENKNVTLTLTMVPK